MFCTEEDVLKRKNRLFMYAIGTTISIIYLAFVIEYFKGTKSPAFMVLFSLISVIPYSIALFYYKKTGGLGPFISRLGVLAMLLQIIVTLPTAHTISELLFFMPLIIAIQIYDDMCVCIVVNTIAFVSVASAIIYYVLINGWKDNTYITVYQTVLLAYAFVSAVSLLSNRVKVSANRWRHEKIEEKAKKDKERAETILEASSDISGQIQQIKASIELNANLINTMNSFIGEVNHGMEEVSNSLAQQTEATINIQQSIEKVAELANDLAFSSKESQSNIESGNENIETVKQITDKVKENSILANQEMKNLVGQSKKVRSVIDVIHEIASQTNLLALNASIEAARAGEAGKGFAVVADEIRGLADSTKESIGQIEVILRELEESSNRADTRLTSMLDGMDEQNKRIADTYESLHCVTSNMKQLMQDIKDISEQMNVVKEETVSVTEAVTEMSAISANVSAHVTQVYGLSNSAKEESVKISSSAGVITESIERLNG